MYIDAKQARSNTRNMDKISKRIEFASFEHGYTKIEYNGYYDSKMISELEDHGYNVSEIRGTIRISWAKSES